jgi:solute:Na+ symporter, SSS family
VLGNLRAIDFVFVAWFLAVSLAVGLHYGRRAGSSLQEYFLSGRDLPWWALGTSLVATTFAADTPLVVSQFTLESGIAGNWAWWNFLIGGALTVLLFAPLWRRSRVVTEVELIELRYDGAPAKALRGFKAIYLGLVLNSIVFGWVTIAMRDVLSAFLGIDPDLSLAVLIAISLLYTAISGLWGVVATDVIQFAMAMVGSILLAALAVAEAGGLQPLVERLRTLEPAKGGDLLAFFPKGTGALAASTAVYLLVNWWAVYYPGAEPGGGGYVAQRMLAAKDERHAVLGTLWFSIAHYALRPWPWILVGLAAAALRPEFLDPAMAPLGLEARQAYPWMMRILPPGLAGLMLASFLAAYMSTITTTLNLSASYVVNDFARPFFVRAGGEKRLVAVARGTVVLVTAVGCLFTYHLKSAGEGWTLVFELTAGIGPVLLLRWLWWRINAWSEIAAIAGSAAAALLLQSAPAERFLVERLVGREAAATARDRLLFAAARGGPVPEIAREEALSFLREGRRVVASTLGKDLLENRLDASAAQRLGEAQRAVADLESAPIWAGEFANARLDRIDRTAAYPARAVASARASVRRGMENREGAPVPQEHAQRITAMDARAVFSALALLDDSVREEATARAERAGNLLGPTRTCLTVALSAIAWILATFLTRPVGRDHLRGFVERVRPPGAWAGLAPTEAAPAAGLSPRRALLLWPVAAVFVYAVLFAIGKCFFLEWAQASLFAAAAAVSGAILLRGLRPLRLPPRR